MKLDIAASTIELGGRTWPAVGVICPCDDSCTDHNGEREWFHGLADVRDNNIDVYIPFESGLLVAIEVDERGINVRTEYRKADRFGDGPASWLPSRAHVVGRTIIIDPSVPYMRSGHGLWHRCEEDWVVELLDHLATFPIEERGTEWLRPVTLIPLKRVQEIFERNCVQRS